MKVVPHFTRWGDAIHLGPFIEWDDWNLHYHAFKIGLEIGPLIFSLEVILWDYFEMARKKALPVLMGRGMSEDEAWAFLDGIYKGIVARREGKIKLWSEVKRELRIKR